MKQFIIFISVSLIVLSSAFAQDCYKDRHSTKASDAWISCSFSLNPVLSNTYGHWIMYNFGSPQSLYKSRIWNINHPDYLDYGIKNVVIHHSMDSINWSVFGTFTFQIADGNYLYEGFEGPNFNGLNAQYITISPLDNYGGACYGFGELKIFTEPEPNSNFELTLNPCENGGMLFGIEGNLEKDGTYSGTGVVNSYENKFDYDPFLAGAGNHIISYTYDNNGSSVTEEFTLNIKPCTDASCLNCAPCGTTPQFVFDSDPVPSGVYYQKEIITSGKVNNYFNVDFKGENAVNMETNFEASENITYLADIKNCDDSGQPINLINNGDFETGDFTGWWLYTNDLASATNSIVTDDVYEGDHSARIDVLFSTGQPSWHIQFINDNGSATLGQQYTVKFAAKASAPIDILFWIGKDVSPWNSYAYYPETQLDTEWRQYEFIFTADEENINELRITPQLGNTIGTGVFWFDNFEMFEN